MPNSLLNNAKRPDSRVARFVSSTKSCMNYIVNLGHVFRSYALIRNITVIGNHFLFFIENHTHLKIKNFLKWPSTARKSTIYSHNTLWSIGYSNLITNTRPENLCEYHKVLKCLGSRMRQSGPSTEQFVSAINRDPKSSRSDHLNWLKHVSFISTLSWEPYR